MVSEFAGEYRQKLDSKGRVSVPSPLRVHFADGDPEHRTQMRGVFVTLNFSPTLRNKCLRIYTQTFMKRIAQSIALMETGSREQRIAQISLLQKTKQLEIDPDGRIVVPKPLRDQFQIGNEVSFNGWGEFVELWDADRWAEEESVIFGKYFDDKEEDFDPLSLLPKISHLRGGT